MREANAVLRSLEDEFLDHEVDTATIVYRWVDKLRGEYEARQAAREANLRAYQDMEYYGLYETELYVDQRGLERRTTVAHHRIKPDDFKTFCKERGLDESRLLAVAVGEELIYQDFIQSPRNGYTIGKEYRAPREIEPEPKERRSVVSRMFPPKKGKPFPVDHDPKPGKQVQP